MITSYGEICDLIACLAVYNGAKLKKKKKHMPFEKAMEVR